MPMVNSTVKLLPLTPLLGRRKERMADVRSSLGITEGAKSIGLEDLAKGTPQISLSSAYPHHLKSLRRRHRTKISIILFHSLRSRSILDSLRNLISLEDHHLCITHSFLYRRDFLFVLRRVNFQSLEDCCVQTAKVASNQSPAYFGDEEFLSLEMQNALDKVESLKHQTPIRSPKQPAAVPSTQRRKRVPQTPDTHLIMSSKLRGAPKPSERAKDAGMTPKSNHTLRQDPALQQPPPSMPPTANTNPIPPQAPPLTVSSADQTRPHYAEPRRSESAGPSQAGPDSLGGHTAAPGAAGQVYYAPFGQSGGAHPIPPQAPPLTVTSADQTRPHSTEPRRSESAGPSQADGLGGHTAAPGAAGQLYYGPYGQSAGAHPYSIPPAPFPPHAHGIFPPLAPQQYQPGAHYHPGHIPHLPQQGAGYIHGHPNAAPSDFHHRMPSGGYHPTSHAYPAAPPADVASTHVPEQIQAPPSVPSHPATTIGSSVQSSTAAEAPPSAPNLRVMGQPAAPGDITPMIGVAQAPVETVHPPPVPPSAPPSDMPIFQSPAANPSKAPRKKPFVFPTLGPNARDDIFSPEYVTPAKSGTKQNEASPDSDVDMTPKPFDLSVPGLPTLTVQPATPSTGYPGVPSKSSACDGAVHAAPPGDLDLDDMDVDEVDGMDIDEISYDRLSDSPTVGRLSSEKSEVLKKGLRKVDKFFKALSKQTGLSVTQIIDRWQLVQFRLPTLWNIYQQYFNENSEEELGRLKEEQRPRPGSVATRGHISGAYKQFKKALGKAFYGQKLKTWYQLHCLTLTDEMTMGQREREFSKYHNKLDNMGCYYSTRWGFEVAIVVVGSVVNQDQNLGKIIMTPGAVDCFYERFNMTDDHLLCHVKSHVYDRVSKQLFAEDQAQCMQPPNKPGTSPTPSATHQGPSAQSSKSNKPKSASLAPPSVKAEVHVELDLSDPDKVEQHRLLTALRKKFEDLGAEYDLPIMKTTGGGQRLQWKQLLAITSEAGYVCINWPENVDFPCDQPVNSSSKSVTKGIAALPRKALLSLYEAFVHTTHLLKLVKKYDGQVPKDQPVLIGAPPEADSCHSHGRRKFLDEQRNEDRQGPPRLASSRSSKRKSREDRKPSAQSSKRRKVSRTTTERFIVDSDEDEESHASYEPEEEDGDDNVEVHSPKRLRSATAAASSAVRHESAEERKDGDGQSDDSEYQEDTDSEDGSADGDSTESSPASVRGSARAFASSSKTPATPPSGDQSAPSPQCSSTKPVVAASARPSAPSPPRQTSSTAVTQPTVNRSQPSTSPPPCHSTEKTASSPSAGQATIRVSPAKLASNRGNQNAAQSNLADKVAQEMFGASDTSALVEAQTTTARPDRQTSEVVDSHRPTPAPPERQASEAASAGRPQLQPQYPYVPPGAYGAPPHQAAWHGVPPMQHWPHPQPPADHSTHPGAPATSNPSAAAAPPSASFDSAPTAASASTPGAFDPSNQLSGYHMAHAYNHPPGHPYNPPGGLSYNPPGGHPGYMYNMAPGQGHYNAVSGPYHGGYSYYHPQPPQPPASHGVHFPAAASGSGHPAGSGEEKVDAKGL